MPSPAILPSGPQTHAGLRPGDDDCPFDMSGPLVLSDEPFAAVWEEYVRRAKTDGVFDVLREALHPLRFSIREGVSQTDAYRAATRRGDLAELRRQVQRTGALRLAAPDQLRLRLHPTPAGRVPVLTVPAREDFVSIVRALVHRNEPAAVPETMGAVLVGGLTNWDRVRRYRAHWRQAGATGTWAAAFRRLAADRRLYQDRLVILSVGPYAGVRSGVADDLEWIRLSHEIRREHECAHVYCKRALGALRSHPLDEAVADLYGVWRAMGHVDPDLVLRLLGVGPGGAPVENGRLWNYRGDRSVAQLSALGRIAAGGVREAARHLNRLQGDDLPTQATAIRTAVRSVFNDG